MGLKFTYVIIEHPTDFAVHEAWHDGDAIIAVNGEPITVYGSSPQDLKDQLGAMFKDIETNPIIKGDCERLYETYDSIYYGNIDPSNYNSNSKVIPLRK
jgi:hypothetical protein